MPDQDVSKRPMRVYRFLGIAAIAIAGGLGIWRAVEGQINSDVTCSVTLSDIVKPGAASGYNVLLVTLDTTRADRLGCYGYKHAKTPAIDSLLDHGVRFDDAITSVPVTLPAHATILTGLQPYHHGVRNNGTYDLPAERTTLAEMLADHGYDTAAFVSCFVLDKRFGLDQGFEVYDFEISDAGRCSHQSLANERGANYVTNAALEWLKTRGKPDGDSPFFLWVHYYDPHAPYESPLLDMLRFPGEPGSGVYNAEISFVDLHLQRLLDKLGEYHLRERTLIVLVSDHGEALGEHGEQYHGVFLYEASMRAALLFSCPAVFDRPYRVDDRVVGTVDIVPTVAALLGVPLAGPVDGLNLLTSRADPERAIYMETVYPKENMKCAPLFGLRRHRDKFVLAPRSEFYDLRRDPSESNNLYGTADPRVGVLEARLSEIMSGWSDSTAAKRIMSPEEVARLASLGYVFGGDGDTESDNLLDPKDQLPLLDELGAAQDLVDQGKYAEAVVMAQEIADQVEGVKLPIYILAEAYAGLGRQDEAVRVLGEFTEKYPSDDMLIALAAGLYALKQYDEMEEKLQAAELINPLEGSIPMLRGDRLFDEQRYAEAAEQYRKAIEVDDERLGSGIRDKLYQAMERAKTHSP